MKKIRAQYIILTVCILISLPIVVLGSKKVVDGVSKENELMKSSDGILTTEKPIEVVTEHTKMTLSPNLDNVGKAYTEITLVIDGIKNPLLCTFEDPKKAMETVKKLDADYIALAQQKYGFGELNTESWLEYKKKILPLDKYYDQFAQLNAFLETYENQDKNENTLRYVNSANAMLKAGKTQKIALDPIIGNLPNWDPIVSKWSIKSRKATQPVSSK